MRVCMFCGMSIEHLRSIAKVCGSIECVNAQRRARHQGKRFSESHCLQCGEALSGKGKTKFCDKYCRNYYNNTKRGAGQERLIGEKPTRREDVIGSSKNFSDQVKLTAGCMDCGYRERAIGLDFDHRPDEIKSFSVSYAVIHHKPLWEVIQEIDKCDVVCAICHRIRTEDRRLQEKEARQ